MTKNELINELVKIYRPYRETLKDMPQEDTYKYGYAEGYAEALDDVIDYLRNSETTHFESFMRYRSERGMSNQKFDMEVFFRKTLEEDFELQGYPKEFAKQFARELSSYWITWRTAHSKVPDNIDDTEDCKIDALADGIMFRLEAIEQLGYDADKVIGETLKEIHSRRGEIIDGKFEKFMDEKSQSLWEQADYNSCRFGYVSE